MINVTHHAVERWIERVNPLLSFDEAHLAIIAHAPILAIAAGMGASAVKLGNGVRLVLCGSNVVTVLASGRYKGRKARRFAQLTRPKR